MKVIIQKFGGTSVSSKERRENVIDKIKQAIEGGYRPVVVVSAMGRKGDPYATDTLLSLVGGNKAKDKRIEDFLMCTGEMISASVLCSELYSMGIAAAPFMGAQAGIKTTDDYSNATVIEVRSEKLKLALEEGIVPVVCGFQGVTKSGEYTTLGRGGSDTSASILGVALEAEKIEIYTDVDGIMTADPRIVKEASLIDEISYDEIFEFAALGASVIHPRAVELARNAGIPLIVRNTLSESKGTVIKSDICLENRRIITGITHMKDRVQFCINNVKKESIWSNIFEKIARDKISLDLINVFPDSAIFTIDKNQKSKLENLLKAENLEYDIIENCSKISVIGAKMRGVPGVMARIISALASRKIEVLQTADSHMTIWCLVEDKNVEGAICALHREFGLHFS